jgi:diacylglycerol kinase
MLNLTDSAAAPTLVALLAGLLLAITLLQSGLDKVFDFKGNLDWMVPHFAKSPLAGAVPALLVILTVLELAAGALCGVGAVLALFGDHAPWLQLGLVLAGLNFCALLLGQRLAKDYAGAAGLVPYFLAALVGLYALG